MGQGRPVRGNLSNSEAGAAPRASAPSYDFFQTYPELDCVKTLLPYPTLKAAADRADLLNITADRVLVAQGLIDNDTYLKRFSMRSGIRLADLAAASRADVQLTDEQAHHALGSGIVRMRIEGREMLVVSLREGQARALMQLAQTSPREMVRLRIVSDDAFQHLLLHNTNVFIKQAIERLHASHPALSAAPVVRTPLRRIVRKAAAGTLGLTMFAIACVFPTFTGNLLALVFLAAIGLRLAASTIPAKSHPAPRLGDADLPDYTVIAALYHEVASVPQLIAALTAFDYPREKLDIILVVETDDLATRAAIARAHPPSCVRVIVAPNEGPRTKPKALNVALTFARGKYVAVFDAEDQPGPDQLRVALAAFRGGDDSLACVQARLAIENSGDSLFTRMYAAEYAGQFDVTMPGYDRMKLPWPLGGTSNHFDAMRLREVCAWDPFNVTEDADLGLRLARFHFTTATIDSTTWEEAPIAFRAWLYQRTRWMKGWIQTWWVHARHPRRYWRRTGWRGLIARDLLIGGALLAALAYPVAIVAGCVALTEYLVTGEVALSAGFVSPLHLASFGGGLLVSIVIQARGLAFRGRLRHAWVLVLTPLYWGCLSAAAWRALLQLRQNPYKWEKTEHGLTKRKFFEPLK